MTRTKMLKTQASPLLPVELSGCDRLNFGYGRKHISKAANLDVAALINPEMLKEIG